jgi:imidazolonepropionase
LAVGNLVIRHIGRLTTWAGPVIADAALVIRDGRVAWCGEDRATPVDAFDAPELDAEGAAALPGFVDCHTHLVWAGSRRDDFIGRLSGASYSPAGIASTVAATRAASYDELLAAAAHRVQTMVRHGATTIEVKSGYGLTTHDELRILDVAADLGAAEAPRITTTYLGAHVVPPDRDRDEYVDDVVTGLPDAKAHGAQWSDVFCDDGAFTVDETRRILTAAKECGLGIRMHAEQLAHTGAAQLAAELRCASADHLDKVDDDDARALAQAGVVAVVVPVASLYTRSGEWAHGRRLLDAGCTLAIATDCNPGTSWCDSMPYAMQVACLGMGLPVETVLKAATLGGAAALRRDDVGHLGVGARGDLVLVTSDHESDVLAHVGSNPINRIVVGGTLLD